MNLLSRMTRRLTVVGPLTLLALLAGVATAAAASVPTLTVMSAGRSPVAGIQDDRMPYTADPAERMRMLADAGAAIVRVDFRWDIIAPSRPANGADPTDPAYDWRQYDAIVAAAATYKIEVLFAAYGTPVWARDPSVKTHPGYRPRFPESSIRPSDPQDFGAFGAAAAKRYTPLGVHKWEAWNEANIALYLQPQYEYVGNRWQAISPGTYSALLKAFYTAVKGVDPAAVVAGGVMAPAGDRRSESPLSDPPNRVTPTDFVTALDAPALRPPMDVVSHHPYPLRLPTKVFPVTTYVDLYNMPDLVRAIDKTYLRGKSLWLTEFGFSTAPVEEYQQYVSRALQADYISDAYRRMRANPRVTMAVYYLLQDHSGWRSGVLTQAGGAKPSYQAIGLPFATTTGATRFARGGRVTLVGQARVGPGPRTVEIQRKSGSTWVRYRKVTTAADGSFRVRLRLAGKLAIRAKWSGTAPSGGPTTRTSPTVTLTTRG
jgi:polysaccharide biosynthesis protein PslG